MYKVTLRISKVGVIWCEHCLKENRDIISGYHLLDFSKMKPKQVCFYSHTYKEFVTEYGQVRADVLKHKASKFIENRCLDYSPENKEFFCKPLRGYNTRTYTLVNHNLGDFECNCQGYQSKLKKGEFPSCSHILALKLAFKMNYFNGKVK